MHRPGNSIGQIGQSVLISVAELGRFMLFCGAVVRALAVHPRRWGRMRLLGPTFLNVGVATIPVVAVTGAFVGMVLALESLDQFKALGQESRLGGVINVAVLKQIGPVLAAVMVAGRVGCALAAELGTMRVTEQLDALRAMATDPILYLVVPRFVACLIMTPVLTVYSDLLGVWGAWLVTVKMGGVSAHDYWAFSEYYLHWWEPTSGLLKSLCFGGAIGLIACYKGFNCGAGASGVGRAATQAFVASFLTIIIVNFILAKILNEIGASVLGTSVSPLG